MGELKRKFCKILLLTIIIGIAFLTSCAVSGMNQLNVNSSIIKEVENVTNSGTSEPEQEYIEESQNSSETTLGESIIKLEQETETMLNGYYTQTYNNGDKYVGNFVNGIKSGQGIYTWASNDYYEGDFNHDTLHGWGIYYWTSGRTYEGWWNLGIMVFEKPDDIE